VALINLFLGITSTAAGSYRPTGLTAVNTC